MILKNEKLKVATFFGPQKVENKLQLFLKLQVVVEDLLKEEVDKFLIESSGDFCALAIKACNQMKEFYYGFEIQRVLHEFVPVVDEIDGTKIKNYYKDVSYYLPKAPKGMAANKELIDMSDIVVVCFGTNNIDSCEKICSYAMQNHKNIVNL